MGKVFSTRIFPFFNNDLMNNFNKYIFNPFYSLRNDRKRILLTNSPAFKIPVKLAEDEITSFIHPIFAIMFSFFNGKDSLNKILNEISEVLSFPTQEVFDFLKPFIENEKRVGIEYDNNFFEFPKLILLDNSNNEYDHRSLNFSDYFLNEEFDFSTYRLYEGPSTITILVNTICATDCTYCYVDRRIKDNCKIPIERLKQLIREAKEMQVVNFDIAGTEIFLYKHWDSLVEELIINGYYPYLSTKLPISEKKVTRLKEIGIKDIQLSIDTLDEEEARVINRIDTPDYINKMFNTLALLEKHDINSAINVVLTNENSSLDGIKKLMGKINQYTNIEKVTFYPAERSAYWDSNDFDKRKNTINDLNDIEEFLIKNKKNFNYEISFSSFSKKSEFINAPEVLLKAHNNRSMCTANKQQMCILSDGQVTICEELYWNPKFIIGNVLSQSIKQIWQSDKALKLEHLTRADFSPMSNCKTCPSFDNCRLYIGVCWSNVASAYGEDNWDFPSPSCPYAPTLKYSMFHE